MQRHRNRRSVIVTLALCAQLWTPLWGDGSDAADLPTLALPQVGHTLSPIEKWQQLGYTELSPPELGETSAALGELRSQVTLVPGTGFFQAPEFTQQYLTAAGFSSSIEIYHRNKADLADRIAMDPLSASLWFARSQLHGPWDYKNVRGSELNQIPMLWTTNDAIGYFNGAYAGVQLFGEDLLLLGFGVVNTLEGTIAGGPLTLGNKPEGYIWAQMGIDYSEKELDQSVRDFLDQSSDPGLQMLYEIDRLNRLSFAQEFQRRWDDLKALTQERDAKTFQYMLKVEADAKSKAAADREGQKRFQELLLQEQEHNREIEDKMRKWRPQPPPSQPSPTRPTTAWQPPPIKPPTATILPPPPAPQPPVWTPLPYQHPGGGGGCDDDCGDSDGQPDVSTGVMG